MSPNLGRQVRRWILVAFYVGCAGLVASAVLGVVLLAAFVTTFGFDPEPAPPDPKRDFVRLTGWTLPAAAEIIRARNTFYGFKGDGDYTLVVRTSTGQIAEWLAAAPPDAWRPCPVPQEIEQQCLELPAHEGTWYRAAKVMPSDRDWHRGKIILLNPETGMVWVYAWKI